jgi:hypothetical protein
MYGVSRYVNPLLMYPLEPLVLVEGKFDRDFLTECFRIASPGRVPRISSLADLKKEADEGGVDALLGYIKRECAAVAACGKKRTREPSRLSDPRSRCGGLRSRRRLSVFEVYGRSISYGSLRRGHSGSSASDWHRQRWGVGVWSRLNSTKSKNYPDSDAAKAKKD